MLLVGQEASRPYDRPPLSKQYLRGRKTRSDLFSIPAEWFAAANVELRTGRRAAHLDTARHAVTLDDGQLISFDNLLIATGASPKRLTCAGADLPNVYYLRTLADADRLRNATDKALREGVRHARGRGKAAVVGGGLLGVELASTLGQLGLHVDMVAGQSWPWGRFVGETTGRFLSRYLQSHDVGLHLDARPERLEGDGRVQRVMLSNGQMLECDLVAAAVGVQVNKQLLRGSSIVAERAIVVDDHCRTSVPGIYAAGDCAAVFDPLFGKHRHIEHWENALVSGRLAGQNMAGGDERYASVSSFSSEVFELSMTTWGEARHVDRRLFRGNPNSLDHPDFVEIGVRDDGRIDQVVAVRSAEAQAYGQPGQSEQDSLLRELVHRRLRVEGIEELLKDPAGDLHKALGR